MCSSFGWKWSRIAPTDPFDDRFPPKRETSALVKGIPHVFLLIVRLLVFFRFDSGISQATNRPHFFFPNRWPLVRRPLTRWIGTFLSGSMPWRRVIVWEFPKKVTFWGVFFPDSNSGGGVPFPNIYIESWCITVLFIRRIYRILEITYCVTWTRLWKTRSIEVTFWTPVAWLWFLIAIVLSPVRLATLNQVGRNH